MNEAKHFRVMADRIAKIYEQEFAGACVIMPPGGGEPIAFLITDPRPDLTQFWASCKARVEIAQAEAMEAAQAAQGGGWPRR